MPVYEANEVLFDQEIKGTVYEPDKVVFDQDAPEDSWSEVIGKSAMQGALAIPKIVSEGGHLIRKAVGMPESGFRQKVKEAEGYWEPETSSRPKEWVGGAVRTLTEMGTAGALSKGTAILPLLSASAGASKAGEALDEGHSAGTAAMAGGLQAATEYLTEKIPLEVLRRPGLNFIQRLAKGLVADVPGEIAATATEMAGIDTQLLGKKYTAEQYKQAIIDTIAVSGLTTVGATTVSHRLGKTAETQQGTIYGPDEVVFDETTTPPPLRPPLPRGDIEGSGGEAQVLTPGVNENENINAPRPPLNLRGGEEAENPVRPEPVEGLPSAVIPFKDEIKAKYPDFTDEDISSIAKETAAKFDFIANTVKDPRTKGGARSASDAFLKLAETGEVPLAKKGKNQGKPLAAFWQGRDEFENQLRAFKERRDNYKPAGEVKKFGDLEIKPGDKVTTPNDTYTLQADGETLQDHIPMKLEPWDDIEVVGIEKQGSDLKPDNHFADSGNMVKDRFAGAGKEIGKDVEMFDNVNKMPPTGLKTEKAQAEDVLEGFRRPEEDRQAGMFSGSAMADTGGYVLPKIEKRTFSSDLWKARKEAMEWARENLQGESFKNEDTGWDIKVGKGGIAKAASGDRQFPQEHLEAVRALPELLQKAKLTETHPDRSNNPDIKNIHRFNAPLEIEGNRYNVKLTVKESADGRMFYDHSLTKIEKTGGSTEPTSSQGRLQGEEVPSIGYSPEPNNNIPPSAEGVKAPVETQDFASLQKVIKEIERIAAPGTEVRIKDRIEIDPRTLQDSLAKWGEGDLTKEIKIKGAHRVVTVSGERLKSVIDLAMNYMNPKITPYHEAFHSVQEFLLTNEEKALLEARYPERDGVSSHERQAQAFAAYVHRTKGLPPVSVRRIFETIKGFLDSLNTNLKGAGYKSAADIFEAAYNGELKKRAEPRGGSSSTADAGGYDIKARSAMEMPEIVELARDINNGRYPAIKERIRAMQGQALGVFSSREGGFGGGKITLKADIFKEPGLAERVLAHEVGHLVDYLPDETLKRGNILGRVASLKKYLGSMIDDLPTDRSTVLSQKDREEIKNGVTSKVMGNDWHWTKGKPTDTERQLIKDGYAEAIDKYIKRNGLITREEITNELTALTQTWKPFDDTKDPKFTAYRYSSKELYADAVSVLVNDPKLLQEKAPKFYDAFLGYLEKKPEVKSVYDGLQERLKDKGAVLENRDTASREMSRRGEDLRAGQEKKHTITLSGLGKEFKKALIDENAELIGRIKKAGREDVRYRLEERAYIPSEVLHYRNKIESDIIKPMEAEGITLEDVGEYVKYRRITTERADIANPLGHTKETAAEQLDLLKTKLGEEKFARLEEGMKKFWETRKENVISVLKDSDMYSEALIKKVEDNENYATFNILGTLEKSYGRGVTGQIFKQIGTLHEIENPFIATVLKDASLIRAARLNGIKKDVAVFLRDVDGSLKPANTSFNGKYHEPVEPRDPELGMITYMEMGKVQAYYAPKEIADTFQYNPQEASNIVRIWQALHVPIRNVLVSKNPLWMVRNVVRDFLGTVKNTPGMTAPKLFRYYWKTVREAAKSAFLGEDTQMVSEMLKNKMIVPDRQFEAKDLSADAQIERMMEKIGESPVRYRNFVVKPFTALWDYLGRAGQFTERWAKMSGYKYLKDVQEEKGLSDEKIGHLVRSRIGTPDVYRRGSWNTVTNNLFLFSNVGKEGWRASYEAFNENRAEYAWKSVKYNIIPKVVLYAGMAGAFGEAIKKVLEGVSDYDKENYVIVPLGSTPEGKSVFFRIPQDYTGQVIGGLAWNLMNWQISGKGSAMDYGFSQFPYTWSPVIEVAQDVAQYALHGLNPYNDYYGDFVLDETVYKAGGKRAWGDLTKYASNQFGGQAIYRFKTSSVNEVEGELEKSLRYPGMSTLGAFLKVSDQGFKEDLREVKQEAATEEARANLEVRDRIIDNINSITEGRRKPAVRDMVELFKDLKKEKLLDPGVSVAQFRHKYERYASRAKNGLEVDAAINATTEERAALLKHYKETMPEKDYKDIIRQMAMEGFNPKKAIVKMRRDKK